jgi:hypothetical protein
MIIEEEKELKNKIISKNINNDNDSFAIRAI